MTDFFVYFRHTVLSNVRLIHPKLTSKLQQKMGYGVGEATNYLLFTNPVSQGLFAGLAGAARGLGITSKSSSYQKSASPVPVTIVKSPLHELAGYNLIFTKVAGISGASALAINAYYTHYYKTHPFKDQELVQIFEKTSRFHFIHSLALLAIPLVRRPWLTGSIMIAATMLFCGSGYYHAFTGDSRYRNVAVIGNCCFFVAWISLLL